MCLFVHRSWASSQKSSHSSALNKREGGVEGGDGGGEESGAHGRKRKKRVVLCPTCLKETHVSKTLAELPRNYVAERRVVAHALSRGSGDAAGVNIHDLLECDSCADNEDALSPPVTVRCVECSENLCSLCETSHRRQRKTKRHQLIDVTMSASDSVSANNSNTNNEASPSRFSKNSASGTAGITAGISPNEKSVSYATANEKQGPNHVLARVLPPKRLACSVHEDESLRLFCVTCDVPVCRDCVVLTHRDHDCQFLCHELFR